MAPSSNRGTAVPGARIAAILANQGIKRKGQSAGRSGQSGQKGQSAAKARLEARVKAAQDKFLEDKAARSVSETEGEEPSTQVVPAGPVGQSASSSSGG